MIDIDISGYSEDFSNKLIEEDYKPFIKVNCCGFQKFITKNNQISREKGNSDYLLIYITRGKCYNYYENKTTEISEGNVIIYNPSQTKYYSYHTEDNTLLFWLHFSGDSAKQYIKNLGLSNQQTGFIGISNEYIDLFRTIIEELQLKRPFCDYCTSACILELLARIARKREGFIRDYSKQKKFGIRVIIENIHMKYNQNYSIDELAKQCNLSVFRFIHLFKEYTGMTPVEYITKIRIDESKYLLSTSPLNISEISSLVGYKNPHYFSKVFKRLTGVTPSEYTMSRWTTPYS